MKKFKPLVISNKFFKYSLPLNMDSYRYCDFQCEYCFMKNRVIGKRNEHLQADINWLNNKFKKVYDDKNVDETNFMDMLLKNRITINFGTKSDPFQPVEKYEKVTESITDLCNLYDQKMIFSTKSDTYYDVDVNPKNHSFFLSFTNHYDDKYLEPNVPSFKDRVRFYNQLKDEGFKVGIRFEPFIPNITDVEHILSYFEDVDHIHLSRLRLLPQLDNQEIIEYSKLHSDDFINRGLIVLKPNVWYTYVKNTLDFLEDNGYSYSTSFIHFGNTDSLGGDSLAWNHTTFNTFHLKEKYGDNWTVNQGLKEIGDYKNCDCSHLWTSNRRNGCKTVEEFYKDKWEKPQCKFHPKNQFKLPSKTLDDF